MKPRCKQFISTVSILAVISISIANMLVLLRVVILWDEHPVSWLVLHQTVENMPAEAFGFMIIYSRFMTMIGPGTYFLKGSRLGGGVLYRMLVTSSSALRERGI